MEVHARTVAVTLVKASTLVYNEVLYDVRPLAVSLCVRLIPTSAGVLHSLQKVLVRCELCFLSYLRIIENEY